MIWLGMWLPQAALALVIAVVAAVFGRVVMSSSANRFGPMVARFTAVLIWGVGLVAALARIGLPTSVTVPILITVLVVIGGTLALLIAGDPSRLVRRQPRLQLIECSMERADDRDGIPEALERDVQQLPGISGRVESVPAPGAVSKYVVSEMLWHR